MQAQIYFMGADFGSKDKTALCCATSLPDGKFKILWIDEAEHLTGDTKMKKLKKKKLTKDQKMIEKLNQDLSARLGEINSHNYAMRKLQDTVDEKEKSLQGLKQENKSLSRKLQLVSSEANEAMMTLEGVAHGQADVNSLQRVLGIVQGRLTTAVCLTATWEKTTMGIRETMSAYR